MKVIEHDHFKGVYWAEFDDGVQKLVTVNSAPGTQVYGEKLIEVEGVEYRLWDPYRSKLAAAIVRGIKDVPIITGSKVLYLGAASGTTASHVADIVGQDGMVYCVEVSSRPLRDLLVVCNRRQNMVPMLADAMKPSMYCSRVCKVDIIYQDVAQPEQSEILFANARTFLCEGGHAMLALKAKSIDVTKEPRDIFRNEMEKLGREFEILDTKVLEPYEKDHAMFLMRKSS